MNKNLGKGSDLLTHLINPRWIFLLMIMGALLSFELFNYSTTEHALMDILGGMEFGSIHWSTLLAIAFCAIDFAGIARLFTPEIGLAEPKEVWYLFIAWLVGATANAILTWWGVMMALTNHTIQSSAIIAPEIILKVVPIFVAVMVWVVRVLIVGTLSIAMDRMLHDENSAPMRQSGPSMMNQRPTAVGSLSTGQRSQPTSFARSAISQGRQSTDARADRQTPAVNERLEPTYHSLSMSSSGNRPGKEKGRLNL
jgi:hypothetical protein